MECTTLATGGFESVLAESSRTIRFVSRVEALQELKQMAYDHGFVLKVRTSSVGWAYLECTAMGKCGFQAKVCNQSRGVMEAWALAVTRPMHNHAPLQQCSCHRPSATQALPLNWTQHRPSQRQVEQENASDLSDARIWRTNSTASNHDQQDDEEDNATIVPRDDADTAALAMGTANLLASGSTSRSENPLEDLVRLPLRLILDALEQLVLVDPIRAELVHERIRQLSTAMQEMKLPNDDERADA